MMMKKILLIEDEDNLRKIIQLNLELNGFEVVALPTAKTVFSLLVQQHFDLILLDIMLPELDGISVCEKIRLQNQTIKIIFMSAKSSSKDRVLGLQKGADDYVVKPFEFAELLFRMQKLLAIQKTQVITSVYKFSNNTINFLTQEAINFESKKIVLTQKEAALLKLLIDNQNHIVSREQILRFVWNYDVFPTTRTIDNFILKFRKYFEHNPAQPQHFISKRGIGYVFHLSIKND